MSGSMVAGWSGVAVGCALRCVVASGCEVRYHIAVTCTEKTMEFAAVSEGFIVMVERCVCVLACVGGIEWGERLLCAGLCIALRHCCPVMLVFVSGVFAASCECVAVGGHCGSRCLRGIAALPASRLVQTTSRCCRQAGGYIHEFFLRRWSFTCWPVSVGWPRSVGVHSVGCKRVPHHGVGSIWFRQLRSMGL
jgi:hypothetical protein